MDNFLVPCVKNELIYLKVPNSLDALFKSLEYPKILKIEVQMYGH